MLLNMMDLSTYLNNLYEGMHYKAWREMSLWEPYTFEVLFETEEWKKLEFALSVDHSFVLDSYHSFILLIPILTKVELFKRFYKHGLIYDLFSNTFHGGEYLDYVLAMFITFEKPVVDLEVVHILLNDEDIPKSLACKCLIGINILNFEIVEYLLDRYFDILSDDHGFYAMCELLYRDDYERSEMTKQLHKQKDFRIYVRCFLPANIETCRYVYDLLF